jgi:hypothetical protein
MHLTEQGSVGTKEGELGEGVAVVGADVERLALGLHVGVVAALHPAFTGESRFRNLGLGSIL